MIRAAEEKDIPAVLRLLEQVAAVHHDIRPDLFRKGATKYTHEELEKIFTDPDTPVFVCEEAGKVLGYCFCVIRRHVNEGALNNYTELYIDDLCVDEACRGQGTGRKLYEHVKSFAKARKTDYITLNVWEGNMPALEFYKHMGLRPLKYVMEQSLKEDT
ncbi:MAG: GNAT family N-acetyltransferase [Clostridiales bacterium]|nr:GNAT family N-acetyltransferase [Clostridiales bacterium]